MPCRMRYHGISMWKKGVTNLKVVKFTTFSNLKINFNKTQMTLKIESIFRNQTENLTRCLTVR